MQDIADRREQAQTDLGNNVPDEPDECEQAASTLDDADIANVVSMWKSWRDCGIRCLEIAYAAPALLANQKRGAFAAPQTHETT